MKTVTVFGSTRIEMNSFGDEWTDLLAILHNPDSSIKQKNFALKWMDVVSTMIGKQFKKDGYDRIMTDKFEFVSVDDDPNKETVECNPLPCHVH